MINILLFGARGRMGQLICAEYSQMNFNADKKAIVSIIAGIEHGEHPDIGKTISGIPIVAPGDKLPSADVWVDFSLADPAIEHAVMAAENRIPIVIAATGFTGQQLNILNDLSEGCPILLASNLSVGMGTMDWIGGESAKMLGEDFDPSLVEYHHSTKKDAPSGTALRLIDRIQANGSLKPQTAAMRVGGAIGEHQVRFVGKYEELIITHRAWSRQAFSSGIDRAAMFLLDSAPGFYTVRDMFSGE